MNNEHIERIAILGAGGLGAAYGSQFLKTPGFETWFIARGERADRLRRAGLVVNGEAITVPVIEPDEPGTPTADLIIVALKHHHLDDALGDLMPFVGEQTILLSVMNGLDSEKTLGARYGMEKVLFAIALGIDAVREGNRIDYSAGGRIFFGEPRNDPPSARVLAIQRAFDLAGIPAESPADMEQAMWRKFMINVGINQASAVLGAPYSVFQTDSAAQAIMEALMREAIAVARAEGVRLGDEDIDTWYAFLNTLSPAGKTSMLQDVLAGRKTEVEMFGSKVVQLGLLHGIPTPVNETIARAIQVLERHPRLV